jgi:CDP-diacylglycerol--glycerol-3-phosphate 3-phosphatidyltransferase
VLLTKFDGKEFVGLGVFWLAVITDILDGFLARRRQQVTRLGKLLDPAADKILMSAAFISLVEMGVAPAWMVVVIVGREFAIGALRSFAAAENFVIAARLVGKVKTAVQVVAISLLIFKSQLGEFSHLAPLSLWVALLVTLYSGAEYFVRFGHIVMRGEPDAR